MKIVLSSLAILFCALRLVGADDPYASLRLYDGSWAIGSDTLTDRCDLVGTYFVCQQTFNGKTGALLVFVPAGTPGHFYTQTVLPDGSSIGRGELQIDGNRWTYTSKSEDKGKTTHYRTVNEFTGKDRIHSESAESADDQHWTVKQTADLVRIKP